MIAAPGPRSVCARLKGHDQRLRIDDDGSLSALVGTVSLGPVAASTRAEILPHRAFRREIEGPAALAGPAHRLREDVHVHRLKLAVLAGIPATPMKVPGLTSPSAAGATRRKRVFAPRRTAFRQHGDAKLTDLLQTLANCLKARALSLSRCKTHYSLYP